MKELSIEEKAKRYDEAISIAREYDFSLTGVCAGDIIEDIFPELKESEDERMRNTAINACKYMVDNFENSTKDYEDAISWLEKQGEKKSYASETMNEKGDFDNGFTRMVEKEQKPADKIEPKFKVGDFIVNDYCVGRVVEITNDAYLLDTEQGIPFSCHSTRLWDITKDAKDGDVLVLNDEVFIYAHRKQMYSIAVAHCFVGSAGSFYLDGEFGYTENGNSIHPATKEQRDTLMKAMADAGYTFNFEKKELRKIEQKSAKNKGMNLAEEDMTPFQKKVFCIIDTAIEEEQGLKQVCDELLRLAHDETVCSEEDVKMINTLINTVKISRSSCEEDDDIKDRFDDELKWLNSLKCRVQPQPKQGWSKKDEYNQAWIVEMLYGLEYEDKEYEKKCREMAEWLKSIRPQNRWKPSDEQMEALKNAIHIKPYENPSDSLLWGLYEQLKKLREE